MKLYPKMFFSISYNLSYVHSKILPSWLPPSDSILNWLMTMKMLKRAIVKTIPAPKELEMPQWEFTDVSQFKRKTPCFITGDFQTYIIFVIEAGFILTVHHCFNSDAIFIIDYISCFTQNSDYFKDFVNWTLISNSFIKNQR